MAHRGRANADEALAAALATAGIADRARLAALLMSSQPEQAKAKA